MTLLTRLILIASCSLVAMLEASRPALAQDCSALFASGMFDERSTVISSVYISRFRYATCGQSVTTLEQAKSSAGSFGLGVDGFGVDFGGKSAEKDFAQWKKALCESKSDEANASSNIMQWSRIASKPLVDAFIACIGAPGLHGYVSRTQDPAKFNIVLQYNWKDGLPAQPKVINLTIDNGDCAPRKIDRLVGSKTTLLCKRNASELSRFTIKTEVGEASGELAGIKPGCPTCPVCPSPAAECIEWVVACDPGQFFIDRRHVDGRSPLSHTNPRQDVYFTQCGAYCSDPICALYDAKGMLKLERCTRQQVCEEGANDGVCSGRRAHAQHFDNCRGALRCNKWR